MMGTPVTPAAIDRARLRASVQAKYAEVAECPEQGFHFHTGRPLARLLGYPDDLIDTLPAGAVESFAGTGNPFELGPLLPGERVLDIGSGAGFDSLIAARMVGPSGSVLGIDMTPAMRAKAERHAAEANLTNVTFRAGYMEELPVPDGSIDVVISNGVINLTTDKLAVMREVYRVLRPGGRFQIADIQVQTPVPQDARDDIDLWSG
jgi:arsenite methyltransferase